MQILTNSRRNSFGGCHRRHYYEYELCKRPVVDAEPLRDGNHVHQALEAWYLSHHEGSEARLSKAYAAIYARASENQADEYKVAAAISMMAGYETVYGEIDMEVVAVEQEFKFALINPDTNGISKTWELGGKIDAIVRFAGSARLSIIEHKTTSDSVDPESDYWVKLAIDGQVSAYFPGSRSLGYEVDSLVYDVLKKPALRPYKATALEARKFTKDGKLYASQRELDETVEEFGERVMDEIHGNLDKYFRRLPLARLDGELVEYMGDMWAVGREIADAQRSGRWPKNPRSCDGFGKCPYFDVCAGRDSINNPIRFKDSEQNPELHQITTQEAA